VVAATVLGLLGVPDDLIVEDYGLTEPRDAVRLWNEDRERVQSGLRELGCPTRRFVHHLRHGHS